MAILGAPLPWVRRESYRGVYYVRRWRGRKVLNLWPRRRKQRKSAKQRQRETDFAAAVLAIKWMEPQLKSDYIERCAPAQTLWRDQLMAQLYGTAFAFTTAEGTTIYPKQFYLKVSNALDLLGAETGALLFRQLGQWATLPPGPPGSVLTSSGPGFAPQWA